MIFQLRFKARSIFFLTLLASVLFGCSHSGQHLVPGNAQGLQSRGNPLNASAATAVVTSPAHSFQTPLSLAAMPLVGTTSSAVRANVTTLPATLIRPNAMTYDPDDGNLYILALDPALYTPVLLRVTKAGATSTFATFGYGALSGITYDHAAKSFYITAQYLGASGPEILAVSQTGAETVLAGGGAVGTADGLGSAASFNSPTAVVVNGADGALYVTDRDRIRRVTTSGSVTTFTPAGSIGSTSFYVGSFGITWDSADGNLYVADASTDLIRKVTSSGSLSTIAGACPPFPPYGCVQLQRDGYGPKALFASPTGIVADGSAGVYVADTANNSLRHVGFNGAVTTFAGNGLAHNLDGAGLNAEFDYPVAVVAAGNLLFVLDNDTIAGTWALRSVTRSGNPPPPLKTPISLYDTPTVAAQPFSINWHSGTSPLSTVLWYTEQATGDIVRLATTGVSTEFKGANPPGLGSNGTDLTLGANGTPWFLDSAGGVVDNRTASGVIASYRLNLSGCCGAPNTPGQFALGPDGNVWFFESLGPAQVASVTPNGTVKYINLSGAYPRNMAFARDGTLWFATGNGLERIDLAGNILGTYNYPAGFVTTGADGNIWFTQNDAIGTINSTTGVITVHPIYEPVPGCTFGCSRGIGAMVAGSDGAYWFVEAAVGSIGRLDPNGGFSEYPIYTARTRPFAISNGPDGNIWFSDTGSEKIGRLNIHNL